MNKKRGIFLSLVKNYIYFIITLLLLIVISGIFIGISTAKNVNEENLPNVGLVNKVGIDYENFDTTDIESIGGYIEILDENNKVIYTKGNRKNTKLEYTQAEIVNLTNVNSKYTSFINAFKNKENKDYISIVKIPTSNLKTTYNFKNAPYKTLSSLYNEVIKGIVLIVILVVLSIVIFSFWTSKKISTPLENLLSGLEEVIRGNYNKKLDFQAEKEFESLREAFNLLTIRLKEKEEENNRLEESKKKLITDISHDIKTPITVIKGLSQGLLDGLVEDEKKENYYERIYSKSNLVGELVEDLFQFIKFDTSQYKLNLEKTNVCELMRVILGSYYDDLEDKEFEVTFDIPKYDIFIDVDRKLFSRAIGNLIENTIKYNNKGTKFHMDLNQNKNEINIRICDSGVGIDKEIEGTVFDAFVRGDASRNSDGSGLGLSICKKIIELHKGSIKLICDDDRYNTIFIIKLGWY